MSAPFPVGGLNNTAPGMTPATATTSGEFDATECDKLLVLTNGAGLATTETVLIYTRNTNGTSAVGGGPSGTTPVYDATGNPAKLTATVQSLMLEGGFLYVFVKSVTAGSVGVDIAVKRIAT